MNSLTRNALKIFAIALTLLTLSPGAEAASQYGRVKVYLMRPGVSGSLAVNGAAVGTVNGPERYTGQVTPLSVERVRSPSSGTGFAIGGNRVVIDTMDVVGKLNVVFPEPSDYPLVEDATLTVYWDHFVLSDSFGRKLSDGPVEIGY